LLDFFKALADINRLKIIGLLAQQELMVEQLAEMLNIRPSTVSHHLARLTRVGLASSRAESYYNVYRLEEKALEAMAQRLITKEDLPAITSDVDLDAYDRKVLSNYTLPDGRLKAIPFQQKKLLAILRYVVQAFEASRRYSEPEVNDILSGYHEDYARLRRELVDCKLMGRQGGGGEYWRTT